LLSAAVGVTGCGAPAVSSKPPGTAAATRTPTATGDATQTTGTTASPGITREGVSIAAEVAVGGLSDPVDVANAGDGSGRLFVVEQAGIIRVVRDGAALDRPFLDIRERIASGGERGLLGLAFHPDYPSDPRFFVDYTDVNGDTVVSSFTVDAATPDVADAGSETPLLHVDQPFANHNGGAVAFGPDGMLYIALGDGGSGGDPQGNGQRLDTLLAKILRIDVDDPPSGSGYTVPPDNPFFATAGAKPEIWLTGLRNPWRMRFDEPTRDLWIGDVGQNAWEEIDVARAGVGGLDFGWNRMEGFHCFAPANGCDQTGLTMPVTEYGHEDGCAVIGGVVVHDAGQGKLDGGYLFGDGCSDRVWVIDPTSNGPETPILAGRLGRTLSSIGEGEDGTVYATSLDDGELLRLSGS
ncbi:MAG: PQQ-dependent sugar dehydrogenase, partial [Chloroflexota bacterium]